MARILLLGSGQSGSTLLGMGLSLSPEVSALGEISELFRVDPVQHLCTCELPFGRCPVWGRMFEQGLHEQPFGPDIVQAAMTRAREVDGTQHCVDSCKTEAGLSAELALGTEDARLLYLVRHPCGYVYSQLHNGYELDFALDAWLDEQTKLLSRLEQLAAPFRLVRYEDLARAPSEEFAKVAGWLGVVGPFGERDAAWDLERATWKGRQHVLSGAYFRLHGRPVIAEDTRWRVALSSRAARKVIDAARPLLARLGYED